MKIDLAAVATKFEGVPPGAFVKLDLSSGGSFGICVEDADQRKGVVTLPSSTAHQDQIAWLQLGGVSLQTLVHFPNAVLRPVLSSAAIPGSAIGVPLICAGTKAFIAGYEDRHHRKYFNLETGRAEQVAIDDAVLFTAWSVGHLVDGKFEQIYSYPLSDS